MNNLQIGRERERRMQSDDVLKRSSSTNAVVLFALRTHIEAITTLSNSTTTQQFNPLESVRLTYLHRRKPSAVWATTGRRSPSLSV